MANNRPKMPGIYDIETIIQAGIDPKTGLPIKMEYGTSDGLKNAIKKILRVMDEQDAINRYSWYNLPDSLNSEIVERILYYRGRGMFFYNTLNNEFDFLPCVLDGEIDRYGRYKAVHPLTFNGADEKDLTMMKRNVVNSIYLEELTEDIQNNSCVLLYDYCKQYSQTILSRQMLNDAIIDVEAECIPYMRTALELSTGVTGLRVNDQDQQYEATEAAKQVKKAALSGDAYVPIIGNLEFQQLNEGQVAKAEEYMLAQQSIDNFRLSTYGIENGGLFEKKAHELESEAEVNATNMSSKYQDGLRLRQEFCHIVNSIWGLGIWCDASESMLGTSQEVTDEDDMEDNDDDYNDKSME